MGSIMMTACLWTFGVVELPEVEAHSLYILTTYDRVEVNLLLSEQLNSP